jgi:hypothetical protein
MATDPLKKNADSKPAKPAATDRKALGLTSLKPSEMVEGLDQAAGRAEKMEAREQQKKRAGGNSLHTAIRVENTGQHWRNRIIAALAAVVLLACGGFAYLVYRTNHKTLSPREGNEKARASITDLKIIAEKYPFPESEAVTVEAVQACLVRGIEAELSRINEQIAKDKSDNRPPDKSAQESRDRLLALKEFKDPWGQPFELKISPDDTLLITVAGKPNADGERLKDFEIALKPVKKH